MNAQGTPTKEKIPGGDYSLKTHTTSLFKIHWRVKDWRLKWILWEEYWKSSILKISISFLTMIWLIFLELNDVFKPSTYPKGLNHKPTTLSTVIFWIRMKTHSRVLKRSWMLRDCRATPQTGFGRMLLSNTIFRLWLFIVSHLCVRSTIVLKQLMVSTCYNVKVRLLYRSLQGLTIILNTQLNGKYHRGMTSHLYKFSWPTRITRS